MGSQISEGQSEEQQGVHILASRRGDVRTVAFFKVGFRIRSAFPSGGPILIDLTPKRRPISKAITHGQSSMSSGICLEHAAVLEASVGCRACDSCVGH